MDAYQYFYDGGKPVGRAPVGTFEYDPRPGHEHWHFRQFARYTLLDASKQNLVVSEKEAFCLTPTEPIDLIAECRPQARGDGVPGARRGIELDGRADTGWETPYPDAPGQSFDISGLPNGTTSSRWHEPGATVYERDTTNDVVLRRIRLSGTLKPVVHAAPARHRPRAPGLLSSRPQSSQF
jgi:hypothetical protein